MTYEEPTAEQATAELVAYMTENGIVRIEAMYSGGNDEGGIQDFEKVINVAGVDISSEQDYRGELWSLTDDLMTTKYGGWAFEGSAYGMLTVDVHEGRAWTDGQETEWLPVPSGDEIDVRFGEQETLEELRKHREATWEKLLVAEQTSGGGIAGLAQQVEYLDSKIEAMERAGEEASATRDEHDFMVTISVVATEPNIPTVDDIKKALYQGVAVIDSEDAIEVRRA